MPKKTAKKEKKILFVLYANEQKIATAEVENDELFLKFQEQLKQNYPKLDLVVEETEINSFNYISYMDKYLIEKEGVIRPKDEWDIIYKRFNNQATEHANVLEYLSTLPTKAEDTKIIEPVVKLIDAKVEQIQKDYQEAIKNPKFLEFYNRL